MYWKWSTRGGFAKEAAVSSLAIVLDQYDAPAGHERLERLLEASYLGGLAASHCSVGVVHAFSHSVAPEPRSDHADGSGPRSIVLSAGG